MVEVDGASGGGQILRTALTLSMLAEEAVTVTDVRGDRSEPGLKPQHLTAVQTAAEVCDADVEGGELGSDEVAFDPGDPTGGTYEATIGTAGSVTLLFDTFLPLATTLEEPLTLAASGGTDVKWSPPLPFYRQVKLPLLRAAGLAAAVDPVRTGYYPAGGGRARLRLWPSPAPEFRLDGRVDDPVASVYSKAAAELSDADVADRQADAAAERLARRGIDVRRRTVVETETRSPGSTVLVRVTGAGSGSERDDAPPGPVAGFDAYGEPGKPAEDVAADAVEDAERFLAGSGAVDRHLADQLLAFLAVGGGRVAVPDVTDHVSTSFDVLAAFGYDLSVDRSGPVPVVASDG
ncbi:MAG: RNA 3'-terminal phosphate cyclase [Haloarculaceae archaeon]